MRILRFFVDLLLNHQRIKTHQFITGLHLFTALDRPSHRIVTTNTTDNASILRALQDAMLNHADNHFTSRYLVRLPFHLLLNAPQPVKQPA